ncbi:hypothetical protein Q8A67_003885 [Cirrhinus molitorella]|uniref:Uncharacterized protein n=1 Tax=Cirrhinus molitorella TaxID=172907 RepID=A0AA88QAL6_9TELE|nr:hypothetical protein Q8A67_003885 [Cirrhinus molitorella]
MRVPHGGNALFSEQGAGGGLQGVLEGARSLTIHSFTTRSSTELYSVIQRNTTQLQGVQNIKTWTSRIKGEKMRRISLNSCRNESIGQASALPCLSIVHSFPEVEPDGRPLSQGQDQKSTLINRFFPYCIIAILQMQGWIFTVCCKDTMTL